MERSLNLIGQTFGRLVVTEKLPARGRKGRWLCKCDCGNYKETSTSYLTTGDTRSCGCLGDETRISNVTSHGMSKTPEYRAWKNMKKRCENVNCKDYKDYGARGISVADVWKEDFMAFYNHIGPKPTEGSYSLDRIDYSKSYEPGNVRWASPAEQARNQGKRKDNKTGFTGVYENQGAFLATWYDIEGKQRAKRFLISRYTSEVAMLMAVAYREEKMQELNKLGAGYTEHHGK